MGFHRLLPLTVCLALSLAGVAGAGQVTVFAAASMKDALDEVADAFGTATGDRAVLVLAGSSALARQIAQGAPADVFVSANTGWMDDLQARGRLVAGSRIALLGNRLVLVAHGPDAPGMALPELPDRLGDGLGDGRLAMALVDAVPVGVYGKAALQALDLWDILAPRVAQADNARAALALVALGAAPYGIVYATDAAAEPRVTAVATFPEGSHPPITYPAALIAGHDTPEARAFLDFLTGEAAAATFARHGFTVLGR